MSDDTEQQVPDEAEARAAARGRRIVATALAALALAVFLAVGPLPVPATVDGVHTWVLRGTTAAGLLRQGRLAGRPGDLLTASGRIVVAGGGAPPEIILNGKPARIDSPIGSGSNLSSLDGPDVVEPAVVRTIETPVVVRYRGRGPVESVEETGTPGSAEVAVGAVSGEEVSRTVISAGTPSTVRREPAWKRAKAVALTFDDGPWPASTDAILAVLRDAGVRATFFMVGSAVNKRPAVARRVLGAGMEVGNHTQNHRSLGRASKKVASRQIRLGARTIRRVTGVTPLWFRPPGGSWSAALKRAVKKQHERFVLWTVDPRDWSRPGARLIAQRVLDDVRPGSVVLMHDGGGDRSQTIAALKLVIGGLKARGYSMVTLSALRGLREASLPRAGRLSGLSDRLRGAAQGSVPATP